MSVARMIVDDPAASCAELLIQTARAGGDIVAAGGSTPRSAYELAAAQPDAWRAARIWYGDERCVPADDPRSNHGMLKAALLDRLGAAGAGVSVFRIEGELGPDTAAQRYELALRRAGMPRFDLMLLGIGPDGHTASLFGGKPAVRERSRWVVGVPEAGLEPFVPRVTLTLAAIAAARRVVFLVAGRAKAQIVAEVFGPDARPSEHRPASLVATVNEHVTLLADPAAAAGLAR
jgi:6-phosphogluconolactonase